MKQHVTTVLTLALLVLFSIAPLSAQKLWENEPYGKRAQKNELIQLRDQFSKHFENEDGTITAHIAAGPIHYAQDGEWKTIYHSILPDVDGFKNTWNAHKTYYPKLANERIRTILPSGEVLYDMMDMRMYFDMAGSSVRNIQPQKGVADYNELTYSGVYGAGIDLRLTQNTMKRKMDYVLNDLGVLGAVPSGAEFLVFEEKVQLPAGWVAVLQNNEILLKDDSGVVRAVYENPVFMDTPQHNHDEEGLHNEEEGHDHEIMGNYEIQQLGELVTIKTKVPLGWLVAPHRAFPVIIDPTINLYPDNAAAWSGYCTAYHADGSTYADAPLYSSSVYDAGFNDIIRVGRENTNYSYQGYVKFNISSLPSSCVNSVNLNYRVDYNYSDASDCNVNVRLRHMSADPVANTWAGRLSDIRDGVIYETRQLRCYTTGSGWVSVPMTANLNQLEAAVPSGWFGVGMNTFEGGSHTTCYTRIRGYSSADRPYIAVDYRPNFRVEFSNPTPTNLCAGETQTVSLTVTNTGCMPWTSGWTLPNTVNFSWWGSWQSGGLAGGQDNNPRMLPFTNLAPGASQVVTFNVTAPSTPGNYSIQTDLVRDAVCWFRGNGAPNCGPGNVDYVIPITVNEVVSVDAGSDVATCPSGSVELIGTINPSVYSASTSATYTVGDASTQYVSTAPTTATNSSCPVNLPINIPAGATITSVDVNYDMTGHSGGWMSEQRSYLECINAGGGKEASVFSGSGSSAGTLNYNRTGLTIANGVTGGGIINFRLHAFRTYGGSGCGTSYNYVNNNTFTITVHYTMPASVVWSGGPIVSGATSLTPTVNPATTTNYTLEATLNGCTSTNQVTVTVETPSTLPTSVTGGGNICHGTIVNLQATGGSPAAGAQTVWYQGGCNNAYTEPWMNTNSWDWSNSTTLNSVNGVLNLTSTSNDPMISMPGLGSFDPAVYRYINVRYRVTAGTAGGMEIFFYNTAAPGAIGAHYTGTPLISDNQ